eukprot:4558881-Prymnesium_polylepis.1
MYSVAVSLVRSCRTSAVRAMRTTQHMVIWSYVCIVILFLSVTLGVVTRGYVGIPCPQQK